MISLKRSNVPMKAFQLAILLILLGVSVSVPGQKPDPAQWRTIGKNEYEKKFKFAVSETNADYPVIFTVTTNFIENGKRVRTVTEFIENQSLTHRRIRRMTVADGRTTNTYQVSVGPRVFCSDDGVSWKVSKFECWGPVSIYGPREPESIKYSVTVKSVKGKKFRVYRNYSIFPPYEGYEKKEFRDSVSTIDSRGFFKTVVDTEGTLHPRTVTLRRKQSWITKATIKPVVPPINSLALDVQTVSQQTTTRESLGRVSGWILDPGNARVPKAKIIVERKCRSKQQHRAEKT